MEVRLDEQTMQAIWRAAVAVEEAARSLTLPHVVMKPRISIDGDQWCAIYGDDLASGVAGFGETPYKACEDFDREWENRRLEPIPKKTCHGCEAEFRHEKPDVHFCGECNRKALKARPDAKIPEGLFEGYLKRGLKP